MARKRRYRRKKLFKFKLKKQTTYNIFALILIGSALLIAVSFFQSGSYLTLLKVFLIDKLGWGSILFPIILISFALLLFRLKSFLTKPNVSFGLLLAYICLLALTQSGYVGSQIWNNFASIISGIGAFIVLLGMFFIGLIVLFNTSVDEIIKVITSLYDELNKLLNNLQSKKKKSQFLEKLDIKKPALNLKNENKNMPQEKKDQKDQQTIDKKSSDTDFSGAIISNASISNQVWEHPPLSLLSPAPGQKANRGDVKTNAQTIEKTLDSFGITARVVEVNLGPSVTQYALEINLGTKLSKITALSNDLALALAAPTGQVRIEAPIPGKSLVGIEIPNISFEYVTLRHMLASEELKKNKNKLSVALGLDVSGKPVTANIAKMPHVLIAGATGSGKSVLINSWISSLLFRTTPAEVKMILVDPKRVELTGYNGIPHLLTPVIVEPDKILSALKWAIQEMERRYKLFSEVGVRNIESYNEMSAFQAFPYIVIFIDELADIMAYSPVEVEESICRLAQMARATGIHLVVSTQRPSVDVITGLIKANIPSRIAFNVSSMVDSRVIIDMPGAEKLLGRGDMLYIPPDQAKPTRIQGTFVSEKEVKKLVEYLKEKNKPVEYTDEVTSMPQTWKKSSKSVSIDPSEEQKDDLFETAIKVVCQYDRASASLLQRRLKVGYARAARIIDQLEAEEIISPGEGSKPRDVLIKSLAEYQENKDINTNNKT